MEMENNSSDIFYGKIILFGEYGIIFDSMALTIPFTHFHGELSFDNTYNRYKYTDYDFARNSNAQLESFSVYLKKYWTRVSLRWISILIISFVILTKGFILNQAFRRVLGWGVQGH